MSCRKLSSLILLAAFVSVMAACKKDDETEVLPSLSGLYFNSQNYIAPGEAVRFSPGGLAEPEGVEVGYVWKIDPSKVVSDTLEKGAIFVHWFPKDSLQTYTVTCSAVADGYYGTSYSRTITAVKSGLDQSITGTGIKSTDPKLTVGGVDYYYTRIGNLEWFRNNLAVTTAGVPYVNEEIMSDIYGRYYNYNDAVTACPEGWRLPSEEDWMSLAEAIESPVSDKYSVFENVAAKLYADASFNGELMQQYWPEVGDITNESKLSMLPVGFVNLGNLDNAGTYPGASFNGALEYTVFWTADKYDDEMAYYRYMITGLPDMFPGKGDVNTFGASVRCVRDVE
ncbi:MAG: fibrobacter succinogenes major paralogous domain-containing protein [Bacteroidales bacterium]|nr:fibrobacter succinogenes major paralogous domain-containing protein [Bacteroidales bacterium]